MQGYYTQIWVRQHKSSSRTSERNDYQSLKRCHVNISSEFEWKEHWALTVGEEAEQSEELQQISRERRNS